MDEDQAPDQASLFPKSTGDKLREAREGLGLTLADIANRTRVPTRHLEAIENGEYNTMPSPTYAIGFAKAYARAVGLDDKIIGLGVRADNSVSRERRSLRARYQLIDLANGSVLLDATAGSDAGIDVVGSEYATIAAENTALERLAGIVADQIVARVALYAQRTAAKAP